MSFGSYFGNLLAGAQGLGGLISAGYGIYASEKNAKFQNRVHNENLQFQKDKLAWDQNLQGQIFAREDNAVQRRVADLKAAGINPIFAAGSSAGAGSVVSTVAPHGDGAGMNAATANRLHAGQMVMNMLKMKSDIDHTKADTRRLNEEAKWIAEKKEAEIDSIKLENDIKKWNISQHEIMEEFNRLNQSLKMQEIDRGEIMLVSEMLLVAQRELNLNRDFRDAIIDQVLHQKSNAGYAGGLTGALRREIDRLNTFRVDRGYNMSLTEYNRLRNARLPPGGR